MPYLLRILVYTCVHHHREETSTSNYLFQKSWTESRNWALALCKTWQFIFLQGNINILVKSSGFHCTIMQYIHKEYAFGFISRMFNSRRFIRYSPFWFINPLQYLPVQFSFRLLLWLATLTFTSHFLLVIYLIFSN